MTLVSGDSMGSILGYDALCRTAQYTSRHNSENSILDTDVEVAEGNEKHLMAPVPRRRSSSTRYTITYLFNLFGLMIEVS